MRIVSLIPSATEIIAALGLADRLVGRSHECDFPPGIETLPALTAPKIRLDGDSGAIQRSVRALLEQGLAVYAVDAERLRALKPDVIVTQDQCEVCAASLADVQAAVCDWIGERTGIVSLAPATLDDVWNDIRRVAAACGVGTAAETLIDRLTTRVREITAEAKNAAARPRVACIEWIEPLMAAGNWMPELVARAGGSSLFGESGRHSPWLEWDALVAADPDVIVCLPCGFDLARTESESRLLTQRPAWARLRAVRTGRAFAVDGNAFFNRPGPRLMESLEILAELLHPERFDFGHRGTAWRPLALEPSSLHIESPESETSN